MHLFLLSYNQPHKFVLGQEILFDCSIVDTSLTSRKPRPRALIPTVMPLENPMPAAVQFQTPRVAKLSICHPLAMGLLSCQVRGAEENMVSSGLNLGQICSSERPTKLKQILAFLNFSEMYGCLLSIELGLVSMCCPEQKLLAKQYRLSRMDSKVQSAENLKEDNTTLYNFWEQRSAAQPAVDRDNERKFKC